MNGKKRDRQTVARLEGVDGVVTLVSGEQRVLVQDDNPGRDARARALLQAYGQVTIKRRGPPEGHGPQ